MSREPDSEAPFDFGDGVERIPAHDPLEYLFTTTTVAGARDVANALGGLPEVWELDGRYYPVRRNSNEARTLEHLDAELIPPSDDEGHMELDALLAGLQRLDSPPAR